MKKRLISIFAVLCIVMTVFPLSAFALTDEQCYDKCDSTFWGWGTYIAWTQSDQAIGGREALDRINNLGNPSSLSYKETHTMSKAISCTSALSSEISSSLNYNTGKVSGGLGAKINASFSITNAFTKSVTKEYKTTVKPKHYMRLYQQTYGTKLKVYAIYHSAWIHTTKVNGILSIPKSYEFVVEQRTYKF